MNLRQAGPRLCRLLAEDGELSERIPGELRFRAESELIAPVLSLQRGPWSGETLTEGVGMLVLGGLIIRRVGFGGRFGAELLGSGDLLRPWQGMDHTSLDPVAEWRVLVPTRLAIIDDRVWARVIRYPQLPVCLIEKALRRSRMLAATMAVLHQPHVELRLEMLLWLLADRWGRVRPDGTLMPLELTHENIAELIAARRPTVTSALAELARNGTVTRVQAGYLLNGQPPREMVPREPPPELLAT